LEFSLTFPVESRRRFPFNSLNMKPENSSGMPRHPQTTDHGTPSRNSPLTGGKGAVWEGGLRVPFVVAGPGGEAGACSHARVTQTHVFPSFADLAGAKEALPGRVEGGKGEKTGRAPDVLLEALPQPAR
jgi:hypothetical protein